VHKDEHKASCDVDRRKIAEVIANALNAGGIKYGVWSGVENYPHIGRDIDIILPRHALHTAVKEVANAAHKIGRVSVLSQFLWIDFPIVRLAIIFNNPRQNLLLDFCASSYSISPYLVPAQRLLASPSFYKGSFRVPLLGLLFKRGVYLMLSKRGKRRARTARQLGARLDRKMVAAASQCVGPFVIRQLVPFLIKERLSEDDIIELEKRRRIVRFYQLVRLLTRPAALMGGFFAFFITPLVRLLYNTPPRIAVYGPDGVGKSTLLSNFKLLAPQMGLMVNLRHWRPRLFPPPSKLLGKSSESRRVPLSRDKGSFHLLRILYYWLDFCIGGLVKDKLSYAIRLIPRQTYFPIILYDRGPLDCCVNPHRYGLRSSRGTAVLWKFAPRFHFNILLVDSPASVAARKNELTEQQIKDEMERWKKVADVGLIDAAIRVASDPKDTLDDFCRVVLNFLSTYYAFPAALRTRKAKTFTSSQYCFMDIGGRAFVALPLSPGTIRGGCDVLPPTTKKQRVKWLLFRTLASFNLHKPLLRKSQPLSSLVPQDVETNLKELFRDKDIVFSFYIPTPLPPDRLVAQVMNRRGKTICFVKIGLLGSGIKRVGKEAKALKTVSCFNTDIFRTPDVLFDCERDGMRFVGISAVPRNSRPVCRLTPAILRFLASLQRDGRTFVTNSPYWEELRALVSSYGGSGRATIEAAFAKTEEILEGVEIDFGWCHGDFAPWNLRRYADKFFVIDWEMLHKGFALVDACFFVVQREIFIKHRSPYNIWRQLLTGREMAMTRRILYPNLEDTSFNALVMVGLIDCEVRRAHFFKDHGQEAPSRSVRSEILEIWLRSG